jgi:hypothetical protein
VTQDRAVPAGNDSAEEVTQVARVSGSDGVDAWVELEQAPRLEPLADHPGTEACVEQLPPRHDPVLSLGDPGGTSGASLSPAPAGRAKARS